MKTKITALVIMFFSLMISSSVFAEGYLVTSDLWIKAVINTVEKGPVDAVFYNGGEKKPPAGEIRLSGDTSMRVQTTFPGEIRAILICM